MTKVSEKKIFLPVIFLSALVIALTLVMLLEDPLLYLRSILVDQYFAVSATAYVVFLALSVPLLPFTIAPLIPFVSRVFTPGTTMALTLVAYILGSLLAYALSRYFGRTFVTRIFPEKRLHDYELLYKSAKTWPEKLALRFFSSADSWSYTAGLKEQVLPWKSFIILSLVGSIPSIFILTYSADALSGEAEAKLFSLFFATLLILLSYLYIRFVGRGEKPVTIYTHDWNFHTDDVFAVAALQIMHDQLGKETKIVRTRDEKVLTKAKEEKDVSKRFIVDVGAEYDPDRNLFDHHQAGGAGKRKNDVPYASIGLVWKKFGTLIAGDEDVAKSLDGKYFSEMDMIDNGKEVYSQIRNDVKPVLLDKFISSTLRPFKGGGKEDFDYQFLQSVKYAKVFIEREIQHAKDKKESSILAEGYYHQSKNKEIIITEEKVGRDHFIKFSDTKFIVGPRNSEVGASWGVVIVREEEGRFATRARFPIEWAGKSGEELQKLSGVNDAEFCHYSGDFLAGAKTREGAIEMAEIALERMHKGEDKLEESK